MTVTVSRSHVISTIGSEVEKYYYSMARGCYAASAFLFIGI